ncbi:hypothetical protein [Streptomyces spectabilis]|uniref:Uncharacterized protein n=1 Tax=Streptomyces spectabilis TaxID=68270 RepID=A0A516R5D0_STRST|nr:hypothetical protein [Streptomyces spectabilis]QDQ10866.1 hypothetical protein FH965_09965 [Streptomyces spectabilis]
MDADEACLRARLRRLEEAEAAYERKYGSYDPELTRRVLAELDAYPGMNAAQKARFHRRSLRELDELLADDAAHHHRVRARGVLRERLALRQRAVEERKPRQAGISWPELLVGVSLAPFLQAVAGAYGDRLAGRLGPWTRRGVRRLIRREVRAHGREPQGGAPGPVLELVDEHGVRVLLDARTPAEAVAQLLHLERGELGAVYDRPPHVVWSGDAEQRWRAQGTRDGAAYYSAWDPERRCWEHGPVPG